MPIPDDELAEPQFAEGQGRDVTWVGKYPGGPNVYRWGMSPYAHPEAMRHAKRLRDCRWQAVEVVVMAVDPDVSMITGRVATAEHPDLAKEIADNHNAALSARVGRNGKT
jgi:hypothetical protein